jgi:uncharacterized protein with beta-barrel porin domain
MIFHRSSRKGRLLLSSTLVAGGLTTCALPYIQSAEAACSNTSPVSGETVTCDGSSTTPVMAAAGTSNVTLNVSDGAELITSAQAVLLRTESEVNLFGAASIKTTSSNDHNTQVESDSGITLNGTSSLITEENTSFGVFGDGDNIALVLNGSSHIDTAGLESHGASMWGHNNSIELSGASFIRTTEALSPGAYLYGENNLIILNETSRIETQGKYSYGVYASNDGHEIVLNDSSTITTAGEKAHGVFINVGDDATVTLNSSSAIVTTGSGANAVRFRRGSNTLVNNGTLSSNNAITVFGDDSSGESDTIGNYGIITSGIGVAISLGGGNDSLTLGTGSNITGDIDGGAGTDLLTLVGTGSEDDVFSNFETLSMEGSEWELSGSSSFEEVTVASGVLRVNGSITAPSFIVESGGTLAGNGSILGMAVSSGSIEPGNSIGTLTIDGNFTQTGGSVEIEFDENAVDLIQVTGATVLEDDPALIVVALDGATSGSGVILHSDGGISGTFGTIFYDGNGSASLSYGPNDITLTVIDATSVVAGNLASLQTALTVFDQISAEHIVYCDDYNEFASQWRANLGRECRGRLWARGFARRGVNEASAGNRAFSYRVDGTAFGADAELAPGVRLGASLGASFTSEVLAQEVSEASGQGIIALLYTALQRGRGFAAAALGLGNQTFNLSRQASVAGTTMIADASTDGRVLGGSLQIGMRFESNEGVIVMPSGALSYLHQWIDDYRENGAATGNVQMEEHHTGALRLKAGIEAGRRFSLDEFIVEPHAEMGVSQDLNDGGAARGQFSSSGYQFELQLDDRARPRALAGIGINLALGENIRAHVSYEGEFSRESTAHTVMGGARIIW